MHEIIGAICLVLTLGMFSQWVAWRLKIPAIVLLFLSGLLIGPVGGYLNPEAAFADMLRPFISISIAIILFEGGLSLKFQELRETRKAVHRMVMGAPLMWLLTALSAHYIGGLGVEVSVLVGGILVVTGPTVIMPLLRQARLNARVGSVLKWEGIVNDPIGALFAVLAFEYFTLFQDGSSMAGNVTAFFGNTLIVLLASYALAKIVGWLFTHAYVPDFLKVPFILTSVVLAYVVANHLQEEAGLVAVTVLGMTLGNMRLASIEEIRRFKEVVTLLLVSAVFIVLSASLKFEQLLELDIRSYLFVFVLLFVLRPLMVAVVTFRTGLSWQEKALVGWIAPRGVVCVAVAGIFAATMESHGYVSAEKMVPICFVVVFTTVVLHGFSIRFLGKKLGLVAEKENGVLIVGATPMAFELAEVIKSRDIPVMVADSNYNRLRPIRVGNIPTYYGEVLNDETEHNLAFNQYSYLLAMTDNEAYNSLVCSKYAHEFGRGNIAQIAPESHEDEDPYSYTNTLRGNVLVGEEMTFDRLSRKHYSDWKFVSSRLSDTFTFDDYLKQKGENCLPIMALSSHGKITFNTKDGKFNPMSGDIIFTYLKVESAMNEPGEPAYV